jgi:CDP-diglyceride synthetase
MNPITPEQKASLRSRLIVAAILIILIVPSFFVGQWLFFGIVAIFLALATTEMIMAPHKPFKWYVYLLTYVVVFSYVYWFVFKGNFGELITARNGGYEYHFSLENYFRTLDISIVGIASSIFLYCLLGILDKNFSWNDVAYFIAFTILLGLGFQAFFFCRYYPFYMFGSNGNFNGLTETSKGLLWYGGYSGADLIQTNIFKYLGSSSLLFFVILITSMNDAGAYFVGSAFGKHKMNERISPHKTWEGFFGGWIIGAVAGLIFGLVITFLGYPMLPTLTSTTWYWVAALAVVIPLISDLGDLAFSMIKRNFGIKDYGNILKGHGGIVDRMGSDMFTCIFTAVVCIFITNGWNFFIK